MRRTIPRSRVVRVEAMRPQIKLHLQCGHKVIRAERPDTSNCWVCCPFCPPADGNVTMTMPQARRLCVSLDGVEHQLGRREHAVIEHMILNRPRVVAVASLIDLIWGNSLQPDSAATMIQNYMTRLRGLGFPIKHKPGGKLNAGYYSI